MNAQIVTVNLIPDLCAPVVVRVSQYDVGRPITFKVLDGTGTASISASATATITGTKPSGLGFSVSGTLAGNTVTLNTTLAMTQECGKIPAEIRFTKTGEDIGTANFILAVEPSPHPEGTTDGTQETMADLETRLQGQIDALDSRIDAIEGDQSIIDDIDALDARVTALEQGGSGLSQTEKNLILTLFSKAAYAESDAESAYDALEAMWASSTKTITYNLSHVSSSNTTVSIESGQSYTTTLTATGSYTLNTVKVTMGGVDITSTAYSSGTVSIPSVTGNIVITATAVLAAQSITATYTQSGTVYDTDSLDSLKSDLVVTANYSGGTSETVPASDYTLSGTLTAGTSTITVSYGGKTATFSVTVTANPLPSAYTQYDYISHNGDIGSATTPIITSAQLKSEYTITARMKLPTGSGTYAGAVMGSRTANYGTKQFALFLTPTSRKLGYWYGGTDSTTEILISYDTVHDITVLPVGKSTTYPSNAVIDVDGTEYNTTSTATGQTWSAWFGLFGYAYSATSGTGVNTGVQLGDVIVKDANGDEVYHFVPVDSGEAKGFYELVNGTFYPASGSMTLGNWE